MYRSSPAAAASAPLRRPNGAPSWSLLADAGGDAVAVVLNASSDTGSPTKTLSGETPVTNTSPYCRMRSAQKPIASSRSASASRLFRWPGGGVATEAIATLIMPQWPALVGACRTHAQPSELGGSSSARGVAVSRASIFARGSLSSPPPRRSRPSLDFFSLLAVLVIRSLLPHPLALLTSHNQRPSVQSSSSPPASPSSSCTTMLRDATRLREARRWPAVRASARALLSVRDSSLLGHLLELCSRSFHSSPSAARPCAPRCALPRRRQRAAR